MGSNELRLGVLEGAGCMSVSVKIFRLQGTYRQGGRRYRFSREIRAVNEDQAREELYAQLGSFHRVKRSAITIERVDVISPSEAESLLIRQLSSAD